MDARERAYGSSGYAYCRRIDLKRGGGQVGHRKTADGRDQHHQALEPIAFSAAA